MNKYSTFITVYIVLFFSCKENKTLFDLPSAATTGITFANTVTETDQLNILDYLYFYNGGGVAVGDINNDGLVDVFLAGNQVDNKLYLNKGNLKFEDITASSGITKNSSWNTGAIMGDVNGDGFLDIYVCAVVGINGFYGYNELYINNGDNTFTEKAKAYGLDFETYSSSATFLDYDLDGDLDIYLLNHAIHTEESFGNANLRNTPNEQTGDKLLRNDNGKFTDVSAQAGIFGGANGYGLGVSVADFNQDGYPDIYVGNDFHEDDYYYINNTNGTFTDKLRDYFGHTTRFSMGNDAADINNDGFPDLIALDMLPEDETVLKSSEGDEDFQVQKMRTQRYGYHYQFTRNMLFVNQHNAPYLETALLSGVAATDWSWSSLFADFNQDGKQDIFVSNGITKRPNDLDFINFASSSQIQKKLNTTKLVDQQALNKMPSGSVQNYIFEGQDDLKFKNQSAHWIPNTKTVSGATALADFDNDGDMDIIVNNSNQAASLYVNNTNTAANYLKLKFNYNAPNTFGIGTKVFSYTQNGLQYKALNTVRGFQASSEPVIHFGYGKQTTVDSLVIVWPNATKQTLKEVNTNQTLTISPKNTTPFHYNTFHKNKSQIFKNVTYSLGLNFTHVEDNYVDFNRQKLIPYKISDKGPATAIGDLNNDGKVDIYFGGSKFNAANVYLQTDNGFKNAVNFEFLNDSINEETAAKIADFNGDNQPDLLLGTGGGDFYNTMTPLLDSYYQNKGNSNFTKNKFPNYFENASVIAENDFDNDGDLDVFIGNYATSNNFGAVPKSYLLINTNGNFSIAQNQPFETIGMVTQAVWNDYNNDGASDLIVVGEWMAPTFFKNNNGTFVKDDVLQQPLNGLWQNIMPFDIDADGKTEYLLGNWGLNTKFNASEKHPLKLYYADFDTNGSTETIICSYKNGDYYPLLGLDDLASQLVSLRKTFTSYKAFAGQPIQNILTAKQLQKAKVLEVNTLASGYLKHSQQGFTFIPFKNEMQVAPITTFLKHDFYGNGQPQVLAAGNYFGVIPFHGRFDAYPGTVISDINNMESAAPLGLNLSLKAVKHLNIITVNKKPHVLVTVNNAAAEIYEIQTQHDN